MAHGDDLAPTLVDLHVHTRRGSLDSSLEISTLGAAGSARGLSAIVLAEHSSQWSDDDAARVSEEQGITLIAAREWNSEHGHIIVFGLEPGSPWHQPNQRLNRVVANVAAGGSGGHRNGGLAAMREIVDDCGGAMILAHPFRYFTSPDSLLYADWPSRATLTPEQLAEHPAYQLVDFIEVRNGGCTMVENAQSLAVAAALARKGVAGSDAHSRHELGRFSTQFERPIATRSDLLRELKAGRYCLP